MAVLATVGAALLPAGALARDEGGLYVAGAGFTFQVAAERAMAQNPGGRRFFLLAVPPETAAFATTAPRALVTWRERVLAADGVLLVCQRDIDRGHVDAARLAPGVGVVRGWPPSGGGALVGRALPGEDPANLPASDEALRRLRSTCAE